jgi:hypothetical protein
MIDDRLAVMLNHFLMNVYMPSDNKEIYYEYKYVLSEPTETS